MDKQKAGAIFKQLRGEEFAGWKITRLIDNGKSAAVFRGENGLERAAIKIFDTELIEKFGDTTLAARLEREKLLLGHEHENLVRMLDAGVDDRTGFHYLIMEHLEGDSLANKLDEIPSERVADLIGQLASAVQFLEENNLAHRDIKPANIMISPDCSKATLLDLGVLRPVGEGDLTDVSGPTLFIGTNQYASPEFALRNEVDSVEGWRAVTFYQLGAVLHDLITRTPLFAEYLGVPARLAHAVQSEVVEIRSNAVPPWLITLAQNCLVKSADTRLRLVSWDSFKAKPERKDLTLQLQEQIRQRAAAAATVDEERKRYRSDTGVDADALLRAANNLLQEVLRNIGRLDPPLGRRIVYQAGAKKEIVRCDFEPAQRIGLPNGLTICLCPHVLDPTSKIIRIAGNPKGQAMAKDWQSHELETVYEGRLDQDQIEEQVVLFVLNQVNEAQVSASSDATGEG